MEKKEVKWSKLFALGLGGVVGLSYLGMIGTLINRESKLPSGPTFLGSSFFFTSSAIT